MEHSSQLTSVDSVQLANLLAILLPLGIKVYNQIREASAGLVERPIEQILASADANWESVIAAAQAELAKSTNPA